jgi:hypothetical protein
MRENEGPIYPDRNGGRRHAARTWGQHLAQYTSRSGAVEELLRHITSLTDNFDKGSWEEIKSIEWKKAKGLDDRWRAFLPQLATIPEHEWNNLLTWAENRGFQKRADVTWSALQIEYSGSGKKESASEKSTRGVEKRKKNTDRETRMPLQPLCARVRG